MRTAGGGSRLSSAFGRAMVRVASARRKSLQTRKAQRGATRPSGGVGARYTAFRLATANDLTEGVAPRCNRAKKKRRSDIRNAARSNRTFAPSRGGSAAERLRRFLFAARAAAAAAVGALLGRAQFRDRDVDDLFEPLDQRDRQFLADALRNFVEIGFVVLRQDQVRHAGTVCREHLFLDAADRQHES